MKKRPAELYFVLLLLIFVSINALAAGWAMITKPNGAVLHLTEDWLARSPFPNFLVPGLILFLFNGVLPAATFYGLLKKPTWRWITVFNIYHDKHWSWTYSLFSGIILIIWTTVQICMIDFSWLQPAFIGVGLLIVILTLLPRILRYYTIDSKQS